METTNMMKPAAHLSRTRWCATLAASLASYLAVVRPRGAQPRSASSSTEAWEPARVPTRAAPPWLMLVESDVCQHCGGLVP